MISILLTLFYTDYVGINPATIGLIMLISRMFDGVSDAIMGLSPFGRILAVTCTMPVVKLFGNDQSAWIKTMAIWASIAFILLLICFLKCEEKVVIEAQAKQEKIPLKQSLKALVTNQYFWAVVILWTMQNGIYCVTGTILPYYCKYIFHNDTWMYSALYLTETLIIVVAIFLSPMLLKKYGKRNMSLAGACLALVGQLIFCLNPTNWGFMVFSCIIRGLGFEKCLPKH